MKEEGLPGFPTDRMKIEYLLAAVEKLQAEVAALKAKTSRPKKKSIRVAA